VKLAINREATHKNRFIAKKMQLNHKTDTKSWQYTVRESTFPHFLATHIFLVSMEIPEIQRLERMV